MDVASLFAAATVLAAGIMSAVPPVVLGILAILIIVFIIKSLIKFALVVGVIALIVFIAWQLHLF